MNPTPSDEQRQRIEAFQRTNRLGLATLFFSDLVGSTQLKQNLGDRDAVQLLHAHHVAFRELLASFPNAEEISTAGDSFFLVFAAPSDAVRFALLAQARTHALAAECGYPLRDRIGIHVGEVFIHATEQAGKPKDFFGINVDTCARIMSLGEGDQILLSRFAFDNARQAIRSDALTGIGEVAWLNHGFYEMKGVAEPVDICEVGEIGRACLSPPQAGEKGQRVVTGDEPVLGWRPASGQTVPNTQWVLDRVLGEGGFGEVWLARHQTLKDRRVFKFCFNAEKARSLRREVTLFRVLREHVGAKPGIVAIHDVFFDEPPYYIVMDHVDGPTLAEWAAAHAPLDAVPLETRLEIVAQIADALQTAHDAGVIHRDVKPSNILIADENGAPRAMLTDFGIGQLVSGDTPPGITQIGFTQTMMAEDSMTGTQLYLAPEMLSGNPASTRSDIYALGVVLYQLATGALNRPLTSDWADDLADPLLRDDIRHCVAGDPAKRFAGAAQLAENLRALPQRREKREREEQQRAKSARRRKQRHFATAAAIVLLVAVIALAIAFGREKKLKAEIAGHARRAEDNARTAEHEAVRANNTLAELKKTAPTLLALADSEAGFQRFDNALQKLDAALTLDPALLPAWWRRAWILLGQEQWSDAAAAIRLARQKDPANAPLADILPTVEEFAAAPEPEHWEPKRMERLIQHLQNVQASGELAALSGKLQLGAEPKRKLVEARLKEWLGPDRTISMVSVTATGLIRVLIKNAALDTLAPLRGMPIDELQASPTSITSLEPLRGMHLSVLIVNGAHVSDLSPLQGMPLRELLMSYAKVTDLSPLRGAPLEKFSYGYSELVDLSPLSAAPLREVTIGDNLVTDLSFLANAPLEVLYAANNKIRDLTPLHGKKLRRLLLTGNPITDLSPLRDTQIEDLNISNNSQIADYTPLLQVLKLEKLRLNSTLVSGTKKIEPLRQHPTLKFIAYGNDPYRPAAEFWKEYDAQQAGK